MAIDRDSAPDSTQHPSSAGPATEIPSGQRATGDSLPFARLGDYEIVDRIGHGGMGAVYKGHDGALNRPVAIKVLPGRLARNQEFIERFKAEASAAARLIHPNIIQIHFIGEDQGHHFFVMQYVEGESLADLLKRRGKLSIEETLAIVEPALGGLAAAHRQHMVHRDVKPGNILLDLRHHQVLLADFGLARSLQTSAAGNTATGAIVGTAEYVSPEQGRGMTVDGRSDLYSLGVLMYRMVSGRLPFNADSAMALVFQHAHEKPPPLAETAPEVPPRLVSIIDRLLAKSPADRYQAADDVLADLHEFESSQQSHWPAGKQSTIVHLPLYEEAAPVLPEALAELARQGWWEEIQDRARTLFRRHAPEVLKRLQSTEQQFDGAVAWHERRERALQELAREGESVLAELQQLARDQRAAGAAADELDRQIVSQQEQLDQIRLRQAQLAAHLCELHNQRNILNARLRVVGVGPEGISVSRRSGREMSRAATGIGVALVVLGLVWSSWKGLRKNDGKSGPSASVRSSAPSNVQPAGGTALLVTEVAETPLLEFAGNGSDITKIHPDPEGRVLTAARADGTIELLEMESGQVLKSIASGAEISRGLAISPNGQLVACVVHGESVSAGSKLKVWNLRQADAGATVAELPSRVRPLAITENQGSVLALVSDGTANQLVRWNLETHDELARQSIPDGEFGAFALHPGGAWLAIVRNAEEVIVGHWEGEDKEMTLQTLPASGTVVAFHPVERWLGVGGNDGTITLWDIVHARRIAVLHGEGTLVRGLTFDSSGRRLAVTSEKDVRVWDLSLDYVRFVFPTADVRDASFLASGTQLVTGSRQKGFQVWNATFEALEVNFAQWLANVAKVYGEAEFERTIRPRLAVGERYDPTTAVTRDGRLRARAPSSAMRRGPDGQMHPDTPDGDTIPRLEDARTSEILLRYGRATVLSIAISPEGRFVATGSWDGEQGIGDVRLWDARSGFELKRFIGHVHYANSVAFSPDGAQLLSGGRFTAHLWDLATAREIRRFEVPISAVGRAIFSPDGRLIVTSDNTRAEGIRDVLLDRHTGELLLLYSGPYAEIALSPRDILCDIRYGTIERLDNRIATTSPQPVAEPTPATNPAADRPPTQTAAARRVSRSIPDQLNEALHNARLEFEAGGVNQPFRQTLQSIADDLPEVQIGTGDGPAPWNAIELNTTRTHLDAFKFRSPLEVPADMHWVFSVPGDVGRWYILPVRGSMSGFESFKNEWNLDLAGADLPPASTAIFQTLLDGRILPGQEYIIWNAPVKNEPFEMKLAIKLSAAGTYGGETTLASIAEILGLELKYQKSAATPDGLRQALTTAYEMAKNGRHHTQAFRRLLSPVAELLPEVSVASNNGAVLWNRIAPTESFRFHAVRFRSPLSVPADLHSILVAPFSAPLCGLLVVDEELPDFAASKLEVNVPFPGMGIGPENTAMFYSLPGGKIDPGREYFLWFYPGSSGALPDMDLAIRLSPAGTIPEASDARSIAAAVGLPLPDAPSPNRVSAALQRCRQMFDQGTQTRTEFMHVLEFLLPALPVLNVGRERGTWNHLDLDTSKNLFSAYRLAPPENEPADLFAVLVKSPMPKSGWWFVSPRSNRYFNPERIIHKDARFEELNFPEQNTCVFEAIPRGHFGADDPVVLCFVPEKSDALSLDVALRWSPQGEIHSPGTPRAAAAILGLNLRTLPAPPGSRLLEGHQDAVGAVAFSTDGGLLASASTDGTVRLWDPKAGELSKCDAGHKGGVRSLTLSADGARLATSGGDFHELIVRNAKTMEPIAVVTTDERIDAAALSPDGRWLAGFDSGMDGDRQMRPGTIAVWEVETGRRTEFLRTAQVEIHSVRWTPDSKTLIAAGGRANPSGNFGRVTSGVMKSFDRESGNELRELIDDMDYWTDLAVSSDGKRLVGVKTGCLMKVWDLPSLREVAAVAQDAINPRVAISADGSSVATANPDGTVKLWDANTLRLHRIFRGHDGPAVSVAFAPDGRTIASGGNDAAVRLWELNYVDPDRQLAGPTEPLINSVKMKLIPIAPGEFMMGTPEAFRLPEGYERNFDSERPQHRARITRPFYLAAHEVTVRQFRTFVEETDYRTTAESSGRGGEHLFNAQQGLVPKPELNWKNPGFEQTDNHPVVQVSWHDAVAFCEWLSKKEGARYRLPTEAEWEYACRAGSTTTFSFGDYQYYLKWCGNAADQGLRDFYGEYPVADFSSDGYTFTAPVGSYLPNAFGLYDMHGNAFEWCADWFGETHYAVSEEVDPQGPKSGKGRVQRSASWVTHGVETRSSYRDWGPIEQAQSQLGFRVVRELP
jgi:formylglycine-generating enzyme required for sulfatase activity/serine/threonine protein kinase/sugar lactone lactonase YvrE